MPKEKYPTLLTKIEKMTPTVRNFHFEFREKPRFDFIPGQFVMVEVSKEGEPRAIRKPYSIGSPPYFTGRIELCIKQVEGGFVSNWFFELEEGAKVDFEGPLGAFRLKDPLPEHLLFAATGTGIAPLRSQIYQLLHQGYSKKITLVFGNRYQNEILFNDEFKEMEEKYPNFEFIPVLSRDKQWSGAKGYVQATIRDRFPASTGREVYICGLVPMVNDLKATLLDLGYPKEAIHFEKWT